MPEPAPLERLCRSIALLEAVLSPAWDSRYVSFNQSWSPGRRLASWRNGSGNDWFLLFGADGSAFLKGFDHERAGSLGVVDGMFDGFPDQLSHCLLEPAFSMDDVTFCLWHVGNGWQRGTHVLPEGADPDGSVGMLALLTGDPADYQQFAEHYYERDVSLDAIARIYDHEPLTAELAATLRSGRTLTKLRGDLSEIGYPVAPKPAALGRER